MSSGASLVASINSASVLLIVAPWSQQLTTPVDPREIVNAATSPEVGLQIYAASVLAVAVDTPAERSYLDGLAKALGIEPGLKEQVEQTLRRG